MLSKKYKISAKYVGETGETSNSFYSNWAYLITILFFQSNIFFCQTTMIKISFNILTLFILLNFQCLKTI